MNEVTIEGVSAVVTAIVQLILIIVFFKLANNISKIKVSLDEMFRSIRGGSLTMLNSSEMQIIKERLNIAEGDFIKLKGKTESKKVIELLDNGVIINIYPYGKEFVRYDEIEGKIKKEEL